MSSVPSLKARRQFAQDIHPYISRGKVYSMWTINTELMNREELMGVIGKLAEDLKMERTFSPKPFLKIGKLELYWRRP